MAVVGGAGLVLATAVTFHLVSVDGLATVFGGVDVYLFTGLIGFATAMLVVAQAPRRECCDPTADPTAAEFEQSALAGVRDAAHITVWGGVAFALWDVGSELGWTSIDTTLGAPIAIVAMALLGLVPACGVEVAVAGLFVAGGLPLPALVTYLISEDGSGLIPLGVSRPRAALKTSVITTALAMACGWIMLAIS